MTSLQLVASLLPVAVVLVVSGIVLRSVLRARRRDDQAAVNRWFVAHLGALLVLLAIAAVLGRALPE
ncbi:MAG: hypothetical protein JHD04_01160 [Nocardioides sp.]|nr:hypothetical protein [Nocardioides sp.]